jgi:hypothetical protein
MPPNQSTKKIAFNTKAIFFVFAVLRDIAEEFINVEADGELKYT